MRINVLQHTPNEGPGSIASWAFSRGHEFFVYHPYFFDGVLPKASETDLLIILGGPMSPNDELPWISKERELIKELLKTNKPFLVLAMVHNKSLKFSVLKSLSPPLKK
jgi:GMP synthase - Glutamine amidotransferase domain